ncbi:TIGR04283 family arsenosugar biosynthesis glycosyltransferase [Alcanivorax sp.]|jgi:rSAM/selenodomain-associated transferase 2|nr:TIGR04283 family arsenosugar biosynthesis glycosyltransferase [Alcanivorax sp.]
MSRVSVIVPVLNEADTLAESLTRLRTALADDDELIVVDGGSVDHSIDIARQLADTVLTSDQGRSFQMNAGAVCARGVWLWFIHADTVLNARHREALGSLVSRTLWGRFDVRLSQPRPLFRVIAFMMNWRSRLTGIATGDQALFVRRDVFREQGGFPEQPLMEDIALSRRLRALARPACLRPPVITSSRRWERHGAWRTIWLMWSLRFRYWRGASPEALHREYYRGDAG